MGKSKRSKKRANDGRGYVQSQPTNLTPTQSAAASGAVVVTKQKHDGIRSLVGQLNKREQPISDGNNNLTNLQPLPPIIIDARFVTKLSNIVERLLELGFSTFQLEDLAQNLDQWTLEAALDWLCLNISTLDLPPLFTDGHLRDTLTAAEKNGGNTNDSLTVLKYIAKEQKVREEAQESRDDGLLIAPSDGGTLKPTLLSDAGADAQERRLEQDAAERAEQKAKILQQYADYHSDGEETGEGEGLQVESGTAQSPVEQNPPLLTPLEQELCQKERELWEVEADLANEANNYMRSKHETKQIQQQAKQLRKNIAGIKRKVERGKSLAQNDDEQEHPSEAIAHDDDEDGRPDDDVFGGGFFESSGEKIRGPDPDVEPSIDLHEGHEPKPLIDARIPKGWTGTTPQKTLDETSRKRKLERPKFVKLPAKKGYKLTLRSHKKAKDQSKEWVALEVDFEPGSSLQDFLSLQALYDVDTSVPMYRMFPPVFRDLWLWWLKTDQQEEDAVREEQRAAKSEIVDRLLALIRESNTYKHPSKQEIVATDEEDSSDSVLHRGVDCWEDNADAGVENHEPEPTNRRSSEGMKLRDEFMKRRTSSRYQSLLRQREKLPMASYKEAILEMVKTHSVTIISADTGAGKTTQCPQFLLENALLEGIGDTINIVCTQPRRVAATSIADRVAEEMADPLGDQVGYQIRMDSRKSRHTKLLFCTTGVLLRRLHDDRKLQDITHVIVDEVHERQVQTDVLLVGLKHLLSTSRRDLKIILMSATMDSSLFASYFDGAPILEVPGRTFPVANYYLEDALEATQHIIEEDSRYATRSYNQSEKTTLWVTNKGGEKRREVVHLQASSQELSTDYSGFSLATRLSMDRVDENILNFDLIEDLLQLLLLEQDKNSLLIAPDGANTPAGAVLIFLPGIGEIRALYDRLTSNRSLGNSPKFVIIPLHSKLSSADQRKAFLPSDSGARKIVLSTNIAETSLTIPDVVVVIDSGKERELRRNKRTSTSILVNDWCSKASIKQRAGRAGRIQPGVCIKLFSSKKAQSMKATNEPELKRVPLEEVCLSILSNGMGKNCHEFLGEAPQPPEASSIQAALDVLKEVGAIREDYETLTPLGEHLARLPVDARLGKMLVFGSIFQCLDKVLTITAALSSKSPFELSIHQAVDVKAQHRVFQDPDSDFASLCNVVEAYGAARSKSSKAARLFCRNHCLNHSALRDISALRKDFLDLLCGIGFVSEKDRSSFLSNAWLKTTVNQNGRNWKIVHAIVCAGLWPNVAALKQSKSGSLSLLHNGHELFFHRSSVNAFKKHPAMAGNFVCYFERFGTATQESVSTTCFVNAIPVILFGGVVVVRHTERKVTIDGWMEIDMSAQTGVLLQRLRRQMDDLLQNLLENSKQSLGGDSIVCSVADILL